MNGISLTYVPLAPYQNQKFIPSSCRTELDWRHAVHQASVPAYFMKQGRLRRAPGASKERGICSLDSAFQPLHILVLNKLVATCSKNKKKKPPLKAL